MKNPIIKVSCLVMMLMFTSCRTTTSDYDFQQNFNFSTLKVFTIYPSTALKSNSPVMAQAIGGEIDSILQSKGYKKGNEVHDFVVTFYTEAEVETSYGSVNFDRWKGFWSVKEEPLFAMKGLIVIDVIDGETGNVVWRGWNSRLIGKEANPNIILKNTIAGILRQFPPK